MTDTVPTARNPLRLVCFQFLLWEAWHSPPGPRCQVFAQRITTHLVLSPPQLLTTRLLNPTRSSSCHRGCAVPQHTEAKTNGVGGSIRGRRRKRAICGKVRSQASTTTRIVWGHAQLKSCSSNYH